MTDLLNQFRISFEQDGANAPVVHVVHAARNGRNFPSVCTLQHDLWRDWQIGRFLNERPLYDYICTLDLGPDEDGEAAPMFMEALEFKIRAEANACLEIPTAVEADEE